MLNPGVSCTNSCTLFVSACKSSAIAEREELRPNISRRITKPQTAIFVGFVFMVHLFTISRNIIESHISVYKLVYMPFSIFAPCTFSKIVKARHRRSLDFINYLHVSNHELGVILNFGTISLQYKWFPNTWDRRPTANIG